MVTFDQNLIYGAIDTTLTGGDDRTVINPDSGFGSAQATREIAALEGTFQCEFIHNSNDKFFNYYGIDDATVNISGGTYVGSLTNSVGYYANGLILGNNAVLQSSLEKLDSGETVGILIERTALVDQVTFFVDGVQQGTPVTLGHSNPIVVGASARSGYSSTIKPDTPFIFPLAGATAYGDVPVPVETVAIEHVVMPVVAQPQPALDVAASVMQEHVVMPVVATPQPALATPVEPLMAEHVVMPVVARAQPQLGDPEPLMQEHVVMPVVAKSIPELAAATKYLRSPWI